MTDLTSYRHYKGGIYRLLCMATLESDPTVQMVVYRSSDGSIWTRPSTIFFELIQHQGQTVPRFAPISSTEE